MNDSDHQEPLIRLTVGGQPSAGEKPTPPASLAPEGSADRDAMAAQVGDRDAGPITADERLSALNQLLELSLGTHDLDELVNKSLDILLDLDFLRVAQRGAFFLVEDDAEKLVLKAERRLAEALLTKCSEVPFGYCLCGRAAQTGEIQFASCVDDRHDVRFDGMAPHGHYNIPIQHQGETLGVVVFYLPHGAVRREDEVQFLQAVSDVLANAIHRLATEDELREARLAAEQASRSKSEFLANMSHEIRTPMTAILGFAETLADSVTEPNEVEAVSIIRRNGGYLLNIINDILDLSKIEAGKMTVERLRFDPFQTVAEVEALVRPRAEGKGLTFAVEYRGDLPTVIQSDPIRLKQILINLVGNAIKFTDAGSVQIIVQFDDSGASSRLHFDVVDTGIGLTPNQVAHLFQPFNQADNTTTRKFGGTGLGLTISRRFAALLGGDISIESSEVGGGTRFRASIETGQVSGVRLIRNPISRVVDAASSSVGDRVIDLSGVHILAAEDGPDNQRLISFVLSKAGAQVTLAENGQIALDQALAARTTGKPFDVILMDMQMPVMSGYEATRCLRQAGYDGPIIALTANAMDGDREKCLDAGCDGFATKPIDRRILVETISRYVKRYRGAAQPSTAEEVRTICGCRFADSYCCSFCCCCRRRVLQLQRT